MVRSFEALAVFCLAVTLLVPPSNASIWCKNDENKDVDWFFIYKLPNRSRIHPNNKVLNGAEYLYVDNNTSPLEETWTLSHRKINESVSALFYTIAPLAEWKAPENLVYGVYNDQVNRKSHAKYGHTKGLFMFDEETGVWLIHSVPNFPNITKKGKYKYPETGMRFGQVVFCATFPTSELDTIAYHLRLQHPYIYAKASAAWSKSGNVSGLFQEKFIDIKPWGLDATLRDMAENNYTSFAKHGNDDTDVYLNQVAPGLNSSLLVSTWQRGRGCIKLPSQRNGSFIVENVRNLTFKLQKNGLVKVNNSVDHSKWAISNGTDIAYVCVGTLNRVEPQAKRGGETLCFNNTLLHKLLNATVTMYEPLPRKRQRTEGQEHQETTKKKPRAEKRTDEEEKYDYYEGVDNCYYLERKKRKGRNKL